jgi:hypothetical protein
MTKFQTYLVISSIFSFILLIQIPSRLSKLHDLIGSLILAGLFGFILWPFILIAFHVSKRAKS